MKTETTPSTFFYDAEDVSLNSLTGRLLNRLKRNWLLLLLGLALGAGGGALQWYMKRPFWKVEMMAYSGHLPNRRAAEIVDDLGAYLSNKGRDLFAKELGLTPEQAAQVSSLSGVNNLLVDGERFGTQDDEGVKLPFGVRATVHDPKVVPALEQGLRAFFARQPYVVERVRQDTITHKRHIASLTREIEYMQGIKEQIKKNLENGGKTNIYLSELSSLSDEIWKLEEYRRVWETNNALYSTDLQIIRPFRVQVKPTGPKLTAYLLIGSGIGLALALFIAFRRRMD